MQRRKRTDRVRGWCKRSRYSGTVPPVLAVSRTGGGLRRVCRMAGEASGSRLLWVRGVRGLDVPCDYKKKAPERRRISVELCGKLSSHAVDGLRGFAIRRAVCHGKKRIHWLRSGIRVCGADLHWSHRRAAEHQRLPRKIHAGVLFGNCVFSACLPHPAL